MQNDIIEQIKDKLQRDMEQCVKDKKELKAQGLFSQSDVILGRETEILELQEYIEELENEVTLEDEVKKNLTIADFIIIDSILMIFWGCIGYFFFRMQFFPEGLFSLFK